MSEQYTRGCAVQQGISVHQGISGVHRGDIMINVGKVIGKTIEFVWKPQCTEPPWHTHAIPQVY